VLFPGTAIPARTPIFAAVDCPSVSRNLSQNQINRQFTAMPATLPGRVRRLSHQARRQFAVTGYRATTVKSVADAARVSPNLITRYFGGKEGLFLAASRTSLGLERTLPDPRETLGRRLAEGMVARWTGVDAYDPLLILQRAAGDQPAAAAALTEFLDRESLEPLTSHLESFGLDPADAHDRASAIEALVMGVVTRRRVIATEIDDPMALCQWLQTSLQRLIDGA